MADLYRVFVPWSVSALLLSEAALLTACYTVVTYQLVEADPWPFLLYEGGLLRIGIVVGTILFGLYFADLYARIRVRSHSFLLQQLSLVIGSAFLLQALLSYVDQGLIVPKWVMILGSCLAFLVLFVWRVFYADVLLRAVAQQRVLFIGVSSVTEEIAKHLEDHPEMGMTVIGCIGASETVPPDLSLPRIGSLSNILELAAQTKPDQVVVDLPNLEHERWSGDLLKLRYRGYFIEDAPRVYERVFGRVLLQDTPTRDWLYAGRLGPSPILARLQSLYSIAISIVGVMVTLPFLVLTALAVKLTSPGPALFKQVRVGINGRHFKVYKFRSMYINVDAMTGPGENDPRITPIGKYLRKLRLDELPQFFNVLRGEMLLVGPRPEIPEFTRVFVEKIPLYQQRLSVKPGITGWAQINHRREVVLEDTVKKLGYDLYYMKHTSLALDLYIIFHTLKTMVLSRGSR